MPRRFDADLAADFERALRSVNAAITKAWAPGLADSEIDALAASRGLDIPEEARTWWRWHNGVTPDTRGPQWDLVPSRSLLDLSSVLELYDSDLRAQRQEGLSGLLKPVADSPWIFFRCDGGRDEPVPIYVGGHGETDRLVLPSIGELVIVWIDLIDSGAFQRLRTHEHGHTSMTSPGAPRIIAGLLLGATAVWTRGRHQRGCTWRWRSADSGAQPPAGRGHRQVELEDLVAPRAPAAAVWRVHTRHGPSVLDRDQSYGQVADPSQQREPHGRAGHAGHRSKRRVVRLAITQPVLNLGYPGGRNAVEVGDSTAAVAANDRTEIIVDRWAQRPAEHVPERRRCRRAGTHVRAPLAAPVPRIAHPKPRPDRRRAGQVLHDRRLIASPRKRWRRFATLPRDQGARDRCDRTSERRTCPQLTTT